MSAADTPSRLSPGQVAEIEAKQQVAVERGTWCRWEVGALVVKDVPALLADRAALLSEVEGLKEYARHLEICANCAEDGPASCEEGAALRARTALGEPSNG